MKSWKTSGFLLLLPLIGCNSSSPGGPGISATPNSSGVSNTTITTYKPALGEVENSFRLKGPVTATHVRQGETATLNIAITRGTNFQDDVELQVSTLPVGVSVETASPKIPSSKSAATIELHAAPDAQPGTYTVSVIGRPTSGPDAKSEMQITVDQR
jgi:uncharacterized membrane protein